MTRNVLSEETKAAFVRGSKIFQALPVGRISQIVDCLFEVHFLQGEIIIEEGEVGDTLFLRHKRCTGS